jgi:hypothetical protein
VARHIFALMCPRRLCGRRRQPVRVRGAELGAAAT